MVEIERMKTIVDKYAKGAVWDGTHAVLRAGISTSSAAFVANMALGTPFSDTEVKKFTDDYDKRVAKKIREVLEGWQAYYRTEG